MLYLFVYYRLECFTPLMAVCCSRPEMNDYVPQTLLGQTRMLETLCLLIDAGGCVHSQDKFGCTALQYASRFGRTQLVNALLDAGSNIDAQNCNGWTVSEYSSHYHSFYF